MLKTKKKSKQIIPLKPTVIIFLVLFVVSLNIIKINNNNKKLTLAKWFNNNCEVFQLQVGSFYCF